MNTISYRVKDKEGVERPVSAKRTAAAQEIDTNRDGLCDDDEIAAYMRSKDLIKDPRYARSNVPKLLNDYKAYMQDQLLPQAEAYHTYGEMKDILGGLVQARPDLATLSSIGKTYEGRDIWALKISQGAQGDTSDKPGVVFTGVHHAREWMSLETPLHLAQELINNYDADPAMKNRVDNSEIWIVPMLDPDGYEYSRTEDNWWRKNRTPLYESGCPGRKDDPQPPEPIAIGVDPNRNYYDGNPDHMFLYRPADDLPCDTSDDFGASDYPGAEDYRGPSPASEPEVQAIMKLEYQPNIHGIIDHHGYGEQLLRPWGYTIDPPNDVEKYDEVAARMQAAQNSPYEYLQSCTTYPTTGSSENSHEINGIVNFTIEMGTSFQPSPDEFDDIKQNVVGADLAFLDWVMEKYPATPPAPPPEPPPPVPVPDPAPPSDGGTPT